MIKTLLLAVWVCALALGASTGAVYAVRTGALDRLTSGKSEVIEQRKIKPVQVPVLSDGAVQGYVVAQFLYTAESEALKRQTISPDSILVDEALRFLYARNDSDLRNVRQINLEAMAKQMVENANARLSASVVRDVMVQDLTYVSKDQVKRQ